MSLWLYRCPKGHASIRKSALENDKYRCYACGCAYDHGPYDATEWDFPVLPPMERAWLGNSKAKALLKEGMRTH